MFDIASRIDAGYRARSWKWRALSARHARKFCPTRPYPKRSSLSASSLLATWVTYVHCSPKSIQAYLHQAFLAVRKEGEAPPVDDFVKVETPASKQRDAAAEAAQAKSNPNGTTSQPGSTRTSSEAPGVPPRPAAPAQAAPTSVPPPVPTPRPATRATSPTAPAAATPKAYEKPAPDVSEKKKEETLQANYKGLSEKEKEETLQAAYKACEL